MHQAVSILGALGLLVAAPQVAFQALVMLIAFSADGFLARSRASFAATWVLTLLAVAAAPIAQAVEILRWERMPLAVPLKVGQERIVFIDRNVRVGVPAGVGERLRVQSAGGAVYLRASEPI